MAENNQDEILKKELERIFLTQHEITDGSCGLSEITIMDATGERWDTLYPILKQLHEEKFFRVRKGINGKLYFHTPKK